MEVFESAMERAEGTTAGMKDRMLDFDGLNAVIGTQALIDQGKRYEG